MSSLILNAVSSIRMGVEDFRQQEAARDISAVRNFYAGVLLLIKEALIRAAPNADPMLVIGARLKPVPDGSGGLAMERIGQTTIDFQQIGERETDFGVSIDTAALKALNRIRNDMEHHYTSEPATAIRAAISKGFPVVASLLRQLDEDALFLLGDAWTTMLETKELYDQELRIARDTYSKIEWYSTSLDGAVLRCPCCRSELVEQVDPENERQDWAELRCRTCGELPDMADVIEKVVDEVHGAEVYMRAKDTGEEGPVHRCPCCERETLVESEDRCAACGEALDYSDECMRCGAGISLSDYLGGDDEGLCSYCAYQTEKAMRDD